MKILLLILFGVALVVIGRRSALWGRRRLSEKELKKLFAFNEKEMEAMRFIAKCYALPVGVIRINDGFGPKSALWKYDSWGGIGLESITEYLLRHGMQNVVNKWTVRDFVRFYVEHSKCNEG